MMHIDYSFLNTLLEGCVIIDREYRIVFMNETGALQARRPADYFIGQQWQKVVPGIENTQLFRNVAQCLDTGKPYSFENQYFYPDGSSGWFLVKMEPIPDAVFILTIDISFKKQTETELQKEMERINVLHEIDVSIINMTSPELALRSIGEKIMHVMHVDAISLLLIDPVTNRLDYKCGIGFQTDCAPSTSFMLGEGFPGRAALHKQTLIEPDLVHNHEGFIRTALIDIEGFTAYAVAPLVSKDTVIGVLEVFRRQPFESDKTWSLYFSSFAGQIAILITSARLFKELGRSNFELKLAYDETIEGWSRALEMRDQETEGHTLRVAELAVKLGRRAGFSEYELICMRRGALLHDIGKIGIPDRILNKPAALGVDEWEIMKLHPVYAKKMLDAIDYLRPCVAIPYCHHEHYDGTGYPRGLKGDDIPLQARMFSIIDVWDALSSNRPYRSAWSRDQVITYLCENKGSLFDPDVVDLFLDVIQDIPGSTS
jgi:HD-GYP domain-containing protein (c-di-GMP phosphodiesterase class II)